MGITLRAWQLRGLDWMMRRERRKKGGSLALDAGLGKTSTALQLVKRTSSTAAASSFGGRGGHQDAPVPPEEFIEFTDDDKARLAAMRNSSSPPSSTLPDWTDDVDALLAGEPLPRVPATLIVAPPRVLAEWIRELRTHFGGSGGLAFCVVGSRDLTVARGKFTPGGAWVHRMSDDPGARYLTPKKLQQIVVDGSLDVVLTTYTTLFPGAGTMSAFDSGWVPNALLGSTFSRVIFDEGHLLKRGSGAWHRCGLAVRAGVKWILTGTPICNTPVDLAMQLRLVGHPGGAGAGAAPEDQALWWAAVKRPELAALWRDAYVPVPDEPGVDALTAPFPTDSWVAVFTKEQAAALTARQTGAVAGGMRLPTLEVTTVAVVVDDGPQRELLDVLEAAGAIPRRTETMRHALLAPPLLWSSADNRAKVMAIQEDADAYGADADDDDDADVDRPEYLELFRSGGWDHGHVAHVRKLRALIEEHEPERALIFCHFSWEISAVCDMLRETFAGRVGAIEGTRASRVGAPAAIHSFMHGLPAAQDPRAVRFLVCQAAAGGLGLNLQRASHVYLHSLDWNATQDLQCIARAHRLDPLATEEKVVRVFRLVHCPHEGRVNNVQIFKLAESGMLNAAHRTYGESISQPAVV